MYWTYEKIGEDMKTEHCPATDHDGSVTGTGKCVMNVKAWFDENEAERKRLGWIKHIHPEVDKDGIEFNKQTQYLSWETRWIDEFTMESVPHICEKSAEMMRFEEIAQCAAYESGLVFSPYYG